MFQTFENPSNPETGPPRLADLRAVMAQDGIDAFIVPRADAHQGEYVAPRDDRLAWLTGFTGSAGLAVVSASEAGVFIDGRYKVQVRSQVSLDHFTPVDWPKTQPGAWLAERLSEGAKVGFDPWLHTMDEVEKLRKALPDANVCPVPNLVDRIWTDQPEAP